MFRQNGIKMGAFDQPGPKHVGRWQPGLRELLESQGSGSGDPACWEPSTLRPASTFALSHASADTMLSCFANASVLVIVSASPPCLFSCQVGSLRGPLVGRVRCTMWAWAEV